MTTFTLDGYSWIATNNGAIQGQDTTVEFVVSDNYQFEYTEIDDNNGNLPEVVIVPATGADYSIRVNGETPNDNWITYIGLVELGNGAVVQLLDLYNTVTEREHYFVLQSSDPNITAEDLLTANIVNIGRINGGAFREGVAIDPSIILRINETENDRFDGTGINDSVASSLG